MRRVLAACLLALTTATAHAATLTPCAGSFDGPGLTTCELLGNRPGVVGPGPGTADAIDWGLYSFTVLYEITAYDWGNTWRVDALGQIVYQRAPGHALMASVLHPQQFAVWDYGTYTVLGLEDMWREEGSDFDYNDLVLLVRRTTDDVPEPAALVVLGVGLLCVAARAAQRRRLAA